MNKPDRPIIRQTFFPIGKTATPAPSAVFGTSNPASYYTTMVLSVPAALGNVPVLFGDSSVNVAVGNGIWISPGLVVILSLSNERQIYEIQAPLVDALACTVEAIPISVFDPSQWFAVASVPQIYGAVLFPEMFV